MEDCIFSMEHPSSLDVEDSFETVTLRSSAIVLMLQLKSPDVKATTMTCIKSLSLNKIYCIRYYIFEFLHRFWRMHAFEKTDNDE